MKRWIKGAVLMMAAVILTTTGCSRSSGDGSKPTDLNKALALTAYASCEELEAEFREILVGEMESTIDAMKGRCRCEDDSCWAEPVFESDGASAGITETNVQEAGVDEADLIKSDGTHAFAIVGDRVEIVRVWPFSDFGALASIDPQMQPKSLYLADNKLIVLGEQTLAGSVVRIAVEEVYDVSDPSQPMLIKREEFPGALLDSRRIDSKLYVVMNSGGVDLGLDYALDIDYEELPVCSLSGEPQPNVALSAAIERLKAKNSAIADAASLEDLVPAVSSSNGIACTDVMRSGAASGTDLLILAADTFSDSSAQPKVIGVLGNGGAVYASRDALYVSSSAMVFGWWGVPGFEYKDATVIHRFTLDGDRPSYTGSGEVEGHLVNNNYVGSRGSSRFSMAQFAMSEFEGHLRVATTVDDVGGLDNRIDVLNIATTDLSSVGQVSGLGRGERIYSVRFMGSRAYVVTFKKVDPLYVVDLETPTAPIVAGELKIPGFSTYLHPVDGDQLIGLGFGADDQGSFAWTQGLKLALFDVSDPSLPSEIGHREIGTRGSYSVAVEEHHAFTLDRERGMLALPVEIHEGGSGGSDWGEFAYAGVLLLSVDAGGTFETIGRIVVEEGDGSVDRYYRSAVSVLRTIIIGDGIDDGVITLTSDSIMLNRIDENMTQIGIVNP